MKIIKDDQVKIVLGKDKGRTGRVLVCFPKKRKLIVSGLNLFKKHVKASQDQPGGILEKEFPLDVSKVILLCSHCQKPTRVSYQIDKSGQKYRICQKCQAIITTKTDKK